jgi:uncharacterized protein (TIGR00266 family)
MVLSLETGRYPAGLITHKGTTMNYQLIGDVMQALMLNLDPGEEVVAEAGAMLFSNGAVTFEAKSQGGLVGGLKRMVVGESLSLTHFHCIAPGGVVAFAAPYPGKVQAMPLEDTAWLCQRDSFLCATAGITSEIAFTRRFGGGLFGGEGFTLQRHSGTGTVFLHIGGNLVESTLAAGQTLRVDTGCIAAFEQSVNYDIEFVGGFKNALFGGEGLFLSTLTGPGKVILQTLPLSRLTGRLHNTGDGSSAGGAGGAHGDIGRVFADQ